MSQGELEMVQATERWPGIRYRLFRLEDLFSKVRGQDRVPEVGSRISDSFGYLRDRYRVLFVGSCTEVLYRLRR